VYFGCLWDIAGDDIILCPTLQIAMAMTGRVDFDREPDAILERE
jgi:hypothetical protein